MPRRTTTLRSRLERERRAAKLTQTDLGRLAQVAQGTISKIEGQTMLTPSFAVLARLAWALKRRGRSVDPADLQPKRQPVLVKGLLNQPKKGAGAA